MMTEARRLAETVEAAQARTAGHKLSEGVGCDRESRAGQGRAGRFTLWVLGDGAASER